MSLPHCSTNCPLSPEVIERLFTKLGAIETEVQTVKKEVIGNGQPGLRQRVVALENTHSGDERVKAEKRSKRMMWASIITSAGTLVAIGYHILAATTQVATHVH